MAYNINRDNGIVQDKIYIQVPDGITFAEGTESVDTSNRKYALLVQLVGSSSSAQVSSLPVQANAVYATYVVPSGSITYVGEAQPGTELSAANWRCKRTEDLTTTIRTTWADGNANFDNIAENITTLIYL